ncbi:Triple functional domain protein [Manis javanica]|nr:Triple functional domain protein [Manis javanica]
MAAEGRPMDTTPPSMAVILRSPPAPHSATCGPGAGHDAEDEPMDTTPPSMAVIFRSPPAPHSATFGPRAGHDAEDEPMDTTPPSMAVIFRSPPAPHEAAGSTTAGLLRTSDTRRAGSHRPVSPGPTRCSGRAQAAGLGPTLGLGPDGHATTLGNGTYDCPPAPDKAQGSTSAGLKADAQDEPMDTTPPSMAVIFQYPGPCESIRQHLRRPLRTSDTRRAAVIVRSPLDPHDAVGGTDGPGLGPTPKSDDDPARTPPPSGAAPTSCPRPQTRPWAVQAPAFRPAADAQGEPMDTAPPRLAVILRSVPQAPHEAVGAPPPPARRPTVARAAPMDTTRPSMAVLFRSPPAPHGPWAAPPPASCAPHTHRTGGHPPVTPGPTRGRGRLSAASALP